MLVGAENQSLYHDYYNLIQVDGAKQAYSYLVGWASSLKHYNCSPSSHGYMKNFKFMRGTDWDFSFAPNQKWLLFYFRKPSLKFEKYSRAEILGRFPYANETTSGEFTVRVSTLEMAVKIADYIES